MMMHSGGRVKDRDEELEQEKTKVNRMIAVYQAALWGNIQTHSIKV